MAAIAWCMGREKCERLTVRPGCVTCPWPEKQRHADHVAQAVADARGYGVNDKLIERLVREDKECERWHAITLGLGVLAVALAALSIGLAIGRLLYGCG